MNLTVKDGFKFGVGALLAFALYKVIDTIVALVLYKLLFGNSPFPGI